MMSVSHIEYYSVVFRINLYFPISYSWRAFNYKRKLRVEHVKTIVHDVVFPVPKSPGIFKRDISEAIYPTEWMLSWVYLGVTSSK